MNRVDRWFARASRRLARRTSRRSFLTRFGVVLVGGVGLPLLPVGRASSPARAAAPGEPDPATPVGDPTSCDYWRHCAIDGFLSSCCGGTGDGAGEGSR